MSKLPNSDILWRKIPGLPLSEIAYDLRIPQYAAESMNLSTAAWTLFKMILEKKLHLRT